MIYDPFAGQGKCNVNTDDLAAELLIISDKIDQIPTTDLSSVQVTLTAIEAAINDLKNVSQSGGFGQRSIDLELSLLNYVTFRSLTYGYFYALECNASCRIRGYKSNDLLLLDFNRSTSSQPNNDICFFDLLVNKVGTEKTTFFLNPAVVATSENIYLNVDNPDLKNLFVSLKYVGGF